MDIRSPGESPSQRAARSVLRRAGAAGALMSVGLGACSSPLAPLDADYGPRVPATRARSVEHFSPSQAADPAATARAEAERNAGVDHARPSRLEGLEELSLNIEEVRAATLRNNLDLRVALVDPTIAKESVREEEAKFEAVFRPSLRVFESDQPTFNVTDATQQDGVSVGAGVDVPLRTGGRVSVDLTEGRTETDNPFVVFGTSYDTSLAFSISQPLLRNAGRRASTYSIRVAAINDQITQARTKLEVIRQLAAADRSYWRLYAARRDLEVSQRQYELAQAQLKRARDRVDAGDAPEIEVTRAQSGLASTLEGIITSENNLLVQQRELKRIMNMPGLDIKSRTLLLPTTDPAPSPYRFNPEPLVSEALAGRMEMLELELQLSADLSTIEFNKNQALPLFTLDYRYSIDGLGERFRRANSQAWENDFESWSLGLSGQVPIGNEAAKARVQRAILTRLQRLSTREARQQAITQEVLNAVDGVELGWQKIMAARQAAIAAARTLTAEQEQFDAGARTSTDVLDASTRLSDAQRSEIRAVADYQIALIDLAFSTGTLLGQAGVEFEPFDPRNAPPGGVSDPTGSAFPPAGRPTYAEPEGLRLMQRSTSPEAAPDEATPDGPAPTPAQAVQKENAGAGGSAPAGEPKP